MFLFSASHTISRFLYFLYFEGTCDEHLLAMCAFDGKRSEEEVYLVDWWFDGYLPRFYHTYLSHSIHVFVQYCETQDHY